MTVWHAYEKLRCPWNNVIVLTTNNPNTWHLLVQKDLGSTMVVKGRKEAQEQGATSFSNQTLIRCTKASWIWIGMFLKISKRFLNRWYFRWKMINTFPSTSRKTLYESRDVNQYEKKVLALPFSSHQSLSLLVLLVLRHEKMTAATLDSWDQLHQEFRSWLEEGGCTSDEYNTYIFRLGKAFGVQILSKGNARETFQYHPTVSSQRRSQNYWNSECSRFEIKATNTKGKKGLWSA